MKKKVLIGFGIALVLVLVLVARLTDWTLLFGGPEAQRQASMESSAMEGSSAENPADKDVVRNVTKEVRPEDYTVHGAAETPYTSAQDSVADASGKNGSGMSSAQAGAESAKADSTGSDVDGAADTGGMRADSANVAAVQPDAASAMAKGAESSAADTGAEKMETASAAKSKAAETSAAAQASKPAASQPAATKPVVAKPVAKAPVVAPAKTAPANKQETLSFVDISDQGDRVVVRIDTSARARYSQFTLRDPARLVVDLLGKWEHSGPDSMKVNAGGIRNIRVGKHPDKFRVVFELDKSLDQAEIVESSSGLVITFRDK